MDGQITCFKRFGSITPDRPGDGWIPPAGKEAYTQGARGGIYKDTMEAGSAVIVWSGSNEPAGGESDAMQFIAACAHAIRAGGRFDAQPKMGNATSWRASA